MKRSKSLQILVWILAALAAFSQIACISGGTDIRDNENVVYMTEAPVLPAEEDWGDRLADGKYYVLIYSDLTTDQSGCVWATVGELKFDELPDSIISGITVGDTVQLHTYSFTVQSMEKFDNGSLREIYFNDGTERCFYIGETNMWRFAWPSDVAYTYEDGRYTLPIAVDATLRDELTPMTEGENIYGMPADSDDPSIEVLDSLEDYFSHYRGLESEYASITVRNGEITDVLIVYHP